MRQSLLIIYALIFCSALTDALAVEQKTNSNAAPGAKGSTTRRVDVAEFEKLWQNKSNIVLDVRSPKEFATAHIPGAVNLDVNAAGFEQKLRELKPEKTYLVHCAAGARSARACDIMRRQGFTNVIDLAPGFRAWEKAGKPVEK